jgi:hypothetical protein
MVSILVFIVEVHRAINPLKKHLFSAAQAISTFTNTSEFVNDR